jgi:primosomal protein N''
MNRLFTSRVVSTSYLMARLSIIQSKSHLCAVRHYAKRTNVRQHTKSNTQKHHQTENTLSKPSRKSEKDQDLEKIISDYEKHMQTYKVKVSMDPNFKPESQEPSNVVQDVEQLSKELVKPLHTEEHVEEYMKKQNLEAYQMYFASSYKGDLAGVDNFMEFLIEDKAQDIVVIDLRRKCSWANYFIIVTGASTRHMKVMAKHAVQMVRFPTI